MYWAQIANYKTLIRFILLKRIEIIQYRVLAIGTFIYNRNKHVDTGFDISILLFNMIIQCYIRIVNNAVLNKFRVGINRSSVFSGIIDIFFN